MAKLPVVSGEKTIKALAKVGFIVDRQKGSHVRLEKETPEGVIKLTVPLHRTLKKKNIEDDSQIGGNECGGVQRVTVGVFHGES